MRSTMSSIVLPSSLFYASKRLLPSRRECVNNRACLQVPLALGWALSVHKSQGMTLDRVEVNLAKAFEAGMAYVALSRARSLKGLRISGIINARSLRADPKVLAFYATLGSRR